MESLLHVDVHRSQCEGPSRSVLVNFAGCNPFDKPCCNEKVCCLLVENFGSDVVDDVAAAAAAGCLVGEMVEYPGNLPQEKRRLVGSENFPEVETLENWEKGGKLVAT